MGRNKNCGREIKNRFQETLSKLENDREENLQKLISMPFDKLTELEKYYYELYKGAEEAGYEESASINYSKYSVISEAVLIKKGNDEQAWDNLT